MTDSMAKLRVTAAKALVDYLGAQLVEIDGVQVPLLGGVFAIFGHGNVAGLGQALSEHEVLPTYRAHNEQAMGHAAIAYAKAHRRRRMMACTTSIGPGATNLVTAAAVAHVNRLPVLFLPGDVFASRAPDPVLQQVERFDDPNITANDCLRPVSRFFDRIMRPQQLMVSLPQAIATLVDPVTTGPVTLALPQDVQAEAADFPEAFFAPRVHRIRRPRPDRAELDAACAALAKSERPIIVAGGGVLYSSAEAQLEALASAHSIPVTFTQAGKGALPSAHPMCVGGLGVTGTAAANSLLSEADLVLAVGTRLSDFTTASATLFPRLGRADCPLVSLNVTPFDAVKYSALPLVADAAEGLRAILERATAPLESSARSARIADEKQRWAEEVQRALDAPKADLPADAQVLRAVNRFAQKDSVVVCAAGGLPGDLHKLWATTGPGSYHVEYGYSCMGYEIAGGMGVKMAQPEREVIVMVGDGSYLMMNSEIATTVSRGLKLLIVLLDNRGFGCINRLQRATGGAPFNNLLDEPPHVDFVAHAKALGAHAELAPDLEALPQALVRARAADRTAVVVIRTDPSLGFAPGGAWWEVPMSQSSPRAQIQRAREDYERAITKRGPG